MRYLWLTMLALGALAGRADAQAARRAPARPPAGLTTEAAALTCPHPLGTGVATARTFCDIEAGGETLGGAIVQLPSRRGPATLTFDLHNRHLYSAELVDSGRGYTRATATIGVLTMEGAVLVRAVVQTEFRKTADLLDRIGAGAGQAGVKAVAPIGTEPVSLEIAEGIDAVRILGEKLVVVRADGTETLAGGGRPIAVVSNVRVQYRPRTPPPRR